MSCSWLADRYWSCRLLHQPLSNHYFSAIPALLPDTSPWCGIRTWNLFRQKRTSHLPEHTTYDWGHSPMERGSTFGGWWVGERYWSAHPVSSGLYRNACVGSAFYYKPLLTFLAVCSGRCQRIVCMHIVWQTGYNNLSTPDWKRWWREFASIYPALSTNWSGTDRSWDRRSFPTYAVSVLETKKYWLASLAHYSIASVRNRILRHAPDLPYIFVQSPISRLPSLAFHRLLGCLRGMRESSLVNMRWYFRHCEVLSAGDSDAWNGNSCR